MQNALQFKCIKKEAYIKFIIHFGRALTGIGKWNKNKISKEASELPTVRDEAQEKRKARDDKIQVPVGDSDCAMHKDCYEYYKDSLCFM